MCFKKRLNIILSGFILCLCLAAESEGNIVLKSLVVNPSQTKTQTAILKAYLPKEVKPQDIVDLGDLKINYDVERALYYVYQQYELAPGESITRQIEIQDVWVISQVDLDSLTNRAKELVDALRKTVYFDTAVTLENDIEAKTNEILAKQEETKDALPQTHIAVYRENKERFNAVKGIIAKLEKMVVHTKTSTLGETQEKVFVKTTWWLIIGVIILLGLLSLVFFVIWQRQAIVVEDKKKMETIEGKESKEE